VIITTDATKQTLALKPITPDPSIAGNHSIELIFLYSTIVDTAMSLAALRQSQTSGVIKKK
jgi:hypothetical protein